MDVYGGADEQLTTGLFDRGFVERADDRVGRGRVGIAPSNPRVSQGTRNAVCSWGLKGQGGFFEATKSVIPDPNIGIFSKRYKPFLLSLNHKT
ncbi:MAG: hypothetical protein U9R74_18745 [Pseudomonadota bacterium]|nr:hypothetical protein [Pseudomonadota bacterium]